MAMQNGLPDLGLQQHPQHQDAYTFDGGYRDQSSMMMSFDAEETNAVLQSLVMDRLTSTGDDEQNDNDDSNNGDSEEETNGDRDAGVEAALAGLSVSSVQDKDGRNG